MTIQELAIHIDLQIKAGKIPADAVVCDIFEDPIDTLEVDPNGDRVFLTTSETVMDAIDKVAF